MLDLMTQAEDKVFLFHLHEVLILEAESYTRPERRELQAFFRLKCKTLRRT